MGIGIDFHQSNLEVKRLDWNKTKTIFIIVFSILNVFLYSLYINRYTQAQSIQFMGETSIEESLKSDNISIVELPSYKKESSYVSADISVFLKENLLNYKNQKFSIIDESHITSELEKEFKIRNTKGELQFSEFLLTYVPNGKDYILWKMDEEEREALFFQTVNDYPIYFNQNASLIVRWDEDENITGYDQKMFGEFISYNKKKALLSPIEAINVLYSRDYLRRDSTIKSVSLGYSTLIQLTKTQVFAPTWRIRVQLKDEKLEDYFINAIEGKVIEFQTEKTELDKE